MDIWGYRKKLHSYIRKSMKQTKSSEKNPNYFVNTKRSSINLEHGDCVFDAYDYDLSLVKNPLSVSTLQN